jgi:hypothetical protein
MTLEEIYANITGTDPDTATVRPSDVLGAIYDRITNDSLARERQVQDELRGLEELRRLNEMYPTAKRTRAILELERRYREAGILK